MKFNIKQPTLYANPMASTCIHNYIQRSRYPTHFDLRLLEGAAEVSSVTLHDQEKLYISSTKYKLNTAACAEVENKMKGLQR